jgi:hypothetical protein
MVFLTCLDNLMNCDFDLLSESWLDECERERLMKKTLKTKILVEIVSAKCGN